MTLIPQLKEFPPNVTSLFYSRIQKSTGDIRVFATIYHSMPISTSVINISFINAGYFFPRFETQKPRKLITASKTVHLSALINRHLLLGNLKSNQIFSDKK